MDARGVEVAVGDRDRRRLVSAGPLFAIINGHVAKTRVLAPGDGALLAALVVAQLEADHLLIVAEPDNEVEVR